MPDAGEWGRAEVMEEVVFIASRGGWKRGKSNDKQN
jgi:hypothetical protein